MAQKRNFQSMQAMPDSSGGVALIAVADDGTAWTARTHSVSGHMNHENLEWKQITPLPVNKAINPQGLVL